MSSIMEAPASLESQANPREEAARVLRRVCNEINSELTPGLIHEVNNVLTGIYFNLEFLQEDAQAGTESAERLGEIGQGVERIKEILGRATQIHLNVAERELGYHDLESLVASELDLLRLIFPKTAKISFHPPAKPVNVKVAEYPFRVAMLAVASRIRDLFPTGRIEIPVSILATGQLQAIAQQIAPPLPEKFVALSFRLPCPVQSVEEIDDYLVAGTVGDLSLDNAGKILADIGGGIFIRPDPAGPSCDLILALPRFDLKP
ncbi:MAG: hypothetical protein ACKOAS_03050 [Verrucomicrobiota bacterium]